MTKPQTLQERVADRYADLSVQLRRAADFVVANPLEIASRSLRAVSNDSGVSPATFSRLARVLGYDSFEEMKDDSRQSVGAQVSAMSDKAEALRRGGDCAATMLHRQGAACIANIEAMTRQTDPDRLRRAADRLRNAPNVVLLGALASTGMVEYMAYLAQYFAANWSLAGRMGASFGAQLAQMGPRDVLFIVTKGPYARRAVMAAQVARQAGVGVIVVTGSHKCPALAQAEIGFVVPSDSPQFFSSYVATLVLIETIVAMIVAASEADATAAIRRVEAQNHQLGEYWTG